MPYVLDTQALFDAAVRRLEEQRVEPEPEPVVEESAPPEPEQCPDFSYNVSSSRSGSCTRDELTKLCLQCDRFPLDYLEPPHPQLDTTNGCPRFMESYGYTHGSCYEADKPYCPNCAQYPREKWIFTQPVSSWYDSEVQQFLETFNVHVRMGTPRWELDGFVEDILRVMKTVAQIACAPKDNQ